jgi:hypothetical protein
MLTCGPAIKIRVPTGEGKQSTLIGRMGCEKFTFGVQRHAADTDLNINLVRPEDAKIICQML